MKLFSLDSMRLPSQVRQGEWFEATDENCTWHHAWDVTSANRFMVQNIRADVAAGITPRRVKRVPLTAHNLAMLDASGTVTDSRFVRSDACDPRQPILLITLDGLDWIIDGWHRARRAALMGWPELLAFPLSAAEERVCRICTCCGPADGVELTVSGFKLRTPRHLAASMFGAYCRTDRHFVISGRI